MKREFIFPFVFLTGFLLFITVKIFTSKRKWKEKQNEFPVIKKEENISDEILKAYGNYDSDRYSGLITFLELSKTGKRLLLTGFELKTRDAFNGLANPGDSIYKNQNSDSILLIKYSWDDTVKYHFLLSKPEE